MADSFLGLPQADGACEKRKQMISVSIAGELLRKAISKGDFIEVRNKLKAALPSDASLHRFNDGSFFLCEIASVDKEADYYSDDIYRGVHWADSWMVVAHSKEFGVVTDEDTSGVAIFPEVTLRIT